ncbi:IMP dehydrogenase [Candidatus Saccharibacteria bacterium]|nr:IMP dehydrogenase [Candidatus Saccharibacteria bacterium]
MARYFDEPSRTFSEYLFVPGYSSAGMTPDKVSLQTPLTKFKKGTQSGISLNIPLTSAIMQSVSDDNLAIALAREGGLSFVYVSQSIESQAAMVARAKNYRAGFSPSDTNVKPDQTVEELSRLRKETGHTTAAVTDDGTADGKLLGIVSSRDTRPDHTSPGTKVKDVMTPFDELIVAQDGISLSEANDLIWEKKLNVLPIIDKRQHFVAFVFRKDYNSHRDNPLSVSDDDKRYLVGAGVNTRDYEERIPALVEAGADALCIDSSEGFSEWQKQTLQFVRKKYGNKVKIGAGNVVDGEGFRFLAEAGADFVKVGIGGGSICITREQKGIGRGNATAIQDVAKARDEYFRETGWYVPLCMDGGIVLDYHMTLALAMGADFLMMGRYFARFDESPTQKLLVDGKYVKEYWGEGAARARNWQRYDHGGKGGKLAFEEGVDSYVPYAGSLHDNIALSLAKVRATMTNAGALDIPTLQKEAKITLVSATSIREGGAHDVTLKS